MSKYQFKGQAYISSSRQDKDGCEIVNFKFDASQAVEVAKLKLMGRNLKDYLPVLLNVEAKIASENRSKVAKRKASKIYR